MPHRGRHNADQVLLMALTCGATVEVAAQTARVSPATVHRRLKDPKFCKQLQQAGTDLVQRMAGMLTAAGGEAIKTLLALLKETTPAAVRLGAVRLVLESIVKFREFANLEGRLAALEEQAVLDGTR
jgi:hypothetical protein